jgi:photosystem II stability/assembly factor-like uncharacterized protein
MKRSYACGLLTLLLLSTWLFPLLVQADSGALEWVKIDKPGDTGNLVVTPSEVSEIAIGRDNVIYTIDTPNSKLYRSLDGGAIWKDMTSYLADAGAGLPASQIAVAPDKSGIVAVVTNAGTKVYLSTNGGVEWADTGVPSLEGTIQAIAISNEYTQGDYKVREIAIGTAVWGEANTTGQVWVRRSGSYPVSWQNQGLVIDPLHPGGEVSALAYSPRYSSDTTLLVVASTNSDVAAAYQDRTWLCLLERDILAWNNIAGYPVEIALAGDGVGVSGIDSSLALPSNYSGDEAASRQLFVSYNRQPYTSYDDIYRLDDASVHRFNVAGGSAVDISSIAYKGNLVSGTLLAGATEPITGSLTVQVWRTDEPWEILPDWEESSVPPTGPGNAKVAWSTDGGTAYCGTGQIPGNLPGHPDESAFSASLDGDKWRQMGLIDTVIKIADVVPAPDGESLFLVTYNHYGPEGIWRSAGDPLGEIWERVLTMDTSSDSIILRLSLNYDEDYTLYAAEADGSQLMVSHNRGNTWQWCRFAPGDCPGGPMIDLVVTAEDSAYAALPDGYVASTTSGGRRPWLLTDTGLDDINMLAFVDENTILVGGRKGDVAYSTDGGQSFTLIDEVIASGTGDVQVVADANYHQNGTIFAATNLPDEGIWRWVIGVSTEWEQIDESITELGKGQRIAGLATGEEGTLYALRLELASDTSGGVLRTLNPLEADPDDVEFDLVNDKLPAGTTFDPNLVFPNTLPYLRLTGNAEQNELWTIDTTHQIIYRYQDTLCKVRATLISPGNGDVLPIDASGYIIDLAMCWEGLAGAENYEAAIYLDSAATRTEWSGTSTDTIIFATEGANPARLTRGTDYYWRVRAIEPIKSPWSELRSFVASLAEAPWSPLSDPTGISPLCGAVDTPLKPAFCWHSAGGATGYEFILAGDSEFSNIIIAKTGADALKTTAWECDTELDYATTYFWKVRAISDISYSDWRVCLFTTEAAPASPTQTSTSSPTLITTSSIPTYMILVLVGTGTALFISLLVFIVRTRKRF